MFASAHRPVIRQQAIAATLESAVCARSALRDFLECFILVMAGYYFYLQVPSFIG